METTTDPALADITITCVDFAEGVDPATGQNTSNWSGIASTPNSNGGIGADVFLNTDFETECTDPCFFLGTVMHEFGHNIGIAHNQDFDGTGYFTTITHDGDGTFSASGSTTTSQIAGTSPAGTNDPTSIFNSGNPCASPNCTLNAMDILALNTRFPLPSDPCECPLAFEPCECPANVRPPRVFINGPASLCVDDESEVCIFTSGAGFNTTVTVDGVMVPFSSGCIPVDFSSTGVHTVHVVSCFAACPDFCTEREFTIPVFDDDDECFCVCEAQEQSGPKGRIEEWRIPVDCCDPRPCSELIPDWWIEYLIDDRECFKKEDDCTPPSVGLQGPNQVCQGHPIEFCITGNYNSSTSWSIISGNASIGLGSYSRCREITANSSFMLSVTVCNLEDGEGQEECCVTLTENIDVIECEEVCFCTCEDDDGDIIELIYDCADDDLGDCQDIFYEDDIYRCEKGRR